MSARRPLVAGNWKLNGTRESAVSLATDIAAGVSGLQADVLVCPVTAHLADVQTVLDAARDEHGALVHLGAQNCATEASGAFTGEIAADMIAEFGAGFVIVGHSERRSLFGETSETVAAKAMAVQKANMQPIVCIGETLAEREAGLLEQVLDEQLDAVTSALGSSAMADCVIAYEPVWAIGTGVSASSEQAQEVHAMIRAKLSALDAGVASTVKILYGGSVKPENASELFAQPDIDGGLIGGASLDAESFLAICQAAVA